MFVYVCYDVQMPMYIYLYIKFKHCGLFNLYESHGEACLHPRHHSSLLCGVPQGFNLGHVLISPLDVFPLLSTTAKALFLCR